MDASAGLIIDLLLSLFSGFSKYNMYNGHTFSEFVPQRTSAYISQEDRQIGEMTVRETLDFSGRCQGVGTRYGKLV